MSNLTWETMELEEQLSFSTSYLDFTLAPRRFRAFRLHLGEEEISDEKGDLHFFDLIWFRSTGELIAAEVEESLGTVLPLNFKLKKSTDRYLFLGKFREEEIDDLLPYQGHIIKHLWTLAQLKEPNVQL